ncbi:MAG TPA: hypothetical protein PLQ01_04900 [Methanothrix sp.]|nr:hypothetical protein [Methanothrix sp.]HPC89858.1 hypothetical protein [Methanothrix sp.]HRS85897.1 hypothetical protein [Methanothrix sp.]
MQCCAALFNGALRDGRAESWPDLFQAPPLPHFEGFESAWKV